MLALSSFARCASGRTDKCRAHRLAQKSSEAFCSRIPEGGEDEAIARLVQQQIDIGLDVVTDGELRRFMFQDSERFGPLILIEATPRF